MKETPVEQENLVRRTASKVVRRIRRGRVPVDVAARLDRQHQRIAELERELARLSPQVAAIEERVEDQRLGRDGSPEAEIPADETTVGDLLAEIRAEHARVRARITAATRYEERLRVLEERVLGDGPAEGQR